MANPYQLPTMSAPAVDSGGLFTQPWSKTMREIIIALTAERAPKRYEFFGLSAADLADPAKFVQAGATAGLGTGDYLGWALANGNNGTENYDGYFIYGSTAAAGTIVGDNSSAHVHASAAHVHAAGSITADLDIRDATHFDVKLAACSNWTSNFTVTETAYAGSANGMTNGLVCLGNSASTTPADTGAASVSDNRPLSKSLVPLMRV
jgi:hypothetical protein